MKLKDFLYLSHESQIRISLMFLILFLVLLNFGTEYLFHQTKRALKHQIQQELSATALAANLIWEMSPHRDLKRNLVELSLRSGVNRISFLSSDGEPLVSSKQMHSADDLHIFKGVQPELVHLLKGKQKNDKLGEFFSDLYMGRSGTYYLSYYFPLESQKTQRSVWVMVEKQVSGFATIEKMSRLNAWARTGGLLIAAFVTALLVKSLLRPYRLMVKKAAKEKIIPSFEEGKADGELNAAVGIFEQVIRELKQKEKALRELYQKTDRKAKNLESYNEYILKSMTNGMIICDERGKITRINHPAETILDKSESSVLGKHYKGVFGELSPLRSVIHAAFTEQRPHSIPETSLKRASGESISLNLSSSVVKDEQGNMLGVVVFLTDLTELKKLEQEVAFKDKMATLGEMSSGLAHELRNSMGAILGFGKMIKKRKDEAVAQSQAIDGLVNEAMSMESMLQRFLAFARPFQLKIQETDLKEIIDDCHGCVKEALKENKIAFEFDCQPNFPLIRGDRLLLKQCFQNLIQNSIQAMPNGGKLCVRTTEEQPSCGEKWILVEVSDTGCGIAKEDQERVFNPFFTSREKGTGLGLSLVKKIVSLHNGSIELQSEPGKGTTFAIRLPLTLQPHLPKAESVANKEVDASGYGYPATTRC
ncbi:MAG: PAS domain S-box protein [candidate division Zixibacteria bacterium]|nr:PAS domain S-box protein [candidate division Zixibacteria bacterium]